MIDIEKIKKEIYSLPNYNYQGQFILQGVEGQTDLNYGVGKSIHLDQEEKEFTYPLYNLPYTNSIIEMLGMYRTRVMCMKPKTCYTMHQDYTKRLHIPIESDWERCFMLVGDGIIKMKPDGNYYEVDTTKLHTAVNASKSLRTHLVGLI